MQFSPFVNLSDVHGVRSKTSRPIIWKVTQFPSSRPRKYKQAYKYAVYCSKVCYTNQTKRRTKSKKPEENSIPVVDGHWGLASIQISSVIKGRIKRTCSKKVRDVSANKEPISIDLRSNGWPASRRDSVKPQWGSYNGSKSQPTISLLFFSAPLSFAIRSFSISSSSSSSSSILYFDRFPRIAYISLPRTYKPKFNAFYEFITLLAETATSRLHNGRTSTRRRNIFLKPRRRGIFVLTRFLRRCGGLLCFMRGLYAAAVSRTFGILISRGFWNGCFPLISLLRVTQRFVARTERNLAVAIPNRENCEGCLNGVCFPLVIN